MYLCLIQIIFIQIFKYFVVMVNYWGECLFTVFQEVQKMLSESCLGAFQTPVLIAVRRNFFVYFKVFPALGGIYYKSAKNHVFILDTIHKNEAKNVEKRVKIDIMSHMGIDVRKKFLNSYYFLIL